MGRKLIAFVIGALLALVVAAPVAAETEKTVTLVGTEYAADAWCCGHFMSFKGTAVVPQLGAVTFDATFANGIDNVLSTAEFKHSLRRLQLTLESRNRDTVTIWGSTDWVSPWDSVEEPELTWSVTGGTGRFTGLSGSGTYKVTPPDCSSSHTLVLTITTPWRG